MQSKQHSQHRLHSQTCPATARYIYMYIIYSRVLVI